MVLVRLLCPPHTRKHDVTSITLHLNGMGSHDKLFEALTAMLSRGALNPADITIVRGLRLV